jgi:hypothetical protein
LYLAPAFAAISSTKEEGDGRRFSYWEIKKGNMFYNLHEQNRIVTIIDKAVNRKENQIELALDSVALLGKFPRLVVEKALISPVAQAKNDLLEVTFGTDRLKLVKTGEGRYLAKSWGYVYPKAHQEKLTSFSEYRSFDGLNLPALTTVRFSNEEYDLVDEYRIASVREGTSGVRIPFVNAEFGLVTVYDFRFEPEVKYTALGTLPNDSLVAEWVADPISLRKHNESFKGLKR